MCAKHKESNMRDYLITWFIGRTKHIDSVLAGSSKEAINTLKEVYGDRLVIMKVECYDFIYCY